MTAFALLDCNNFYASVERVFDARLHKRPVVVLSNNDGCIIARSQEAKALGIGMAAPLFKVKDIIEKNNVFVKSANFELYGDMSSRVMELLEEFSPDIEIYSIDEAFFTVPASAPLTQFGGEIRGRVRKCTGLPVSIGFAKTKTLAKLANYLGKRSEKIVDLYHASDSELERALAGTPVEAVWGIGHRSAKKLKQYGIVTALALRNADLNWARKTLSVLGARTVLELRGTSCYSLTHTPDELAARRAVTCSRSFAKIVTTKQEMKEAVSLFLGRAAERMRKLGFAAGALSVHLNTDRFKIRDEYHSNTATYASAVPSDANPELLRWALDCLDRVYHPGFGYKKAGVILTGLVPFNEANARLLDEEYCRRMHSLMRVMDKTNRRWGRDTIRFFNEQNEKEIRKRTTGWYGKSDVNKAGSHTTNFGELCSVEREG
jgi:DNA polymerase V